MDTLSKDKRFKHAVSDPRFKNVPWKERKVKIDKRFQSMFTDKRFQIKYAVDEKGREVNEAQSEHYKKYYHLSDSDSGEENEAIATDSEDEITSNEDTSDENGQNEVEDPESSNEIGKEDVHDEELRKEKLKEANKKVNKYVDEIHKMKINSKIRDKLTDFRVDYARGIGTLLSESSSDESSSDESEPGNIEHPWGELDKDAEETNETTSRLAVCNMDWDRVTANDLMVLFNSFLPPNGVIESVTIYPSEFGLARMAEEELMGPKELLELKGNYSETNNSDEVEEGSKFQREKLREYQLKRLKYYYAVIICNSNETANTLYTECDGIEYESSAMKLDLRFIGDDVTFEQKPHDVCTSLPDVNKYRPRLFVNTALQQGKVELTWDETDPNRIDFNRKLMSGETVDEHEFQTFVANSSSEEEEENKIEGNQDEDLDAGEEDSIKKYRNLLANLQETKSRNDVEMEVTWGADESCIGQKPDESENDDSECSEEKNIKRKSMKNKKLYKRKPRQSGTVSDEQNQHNEAELELLLADDDPRESSLKHFSLKELQKQEKQEQKKKKWQKKKKNQLVDEEDSFKINPEDERFTAIYTSHQFNIDPADPHFRKTKGMEQLISEKQKRRKLE